VTSETDGHRDASLSPPDSRFQILALDGGGVKALFTAHVLARLENDLDISIRDHFDLIAGTSAGGIIALALGFEIPPAQIVEEFERLMARVFPRSRRLNPSRLFRAAYPAGPLREALAGIFGDRLLGDSKKRLLIPSWDVQMSEVRLFKTPHDEQLRRDWKVSAVDVALATSAAPAFFPIAIVEDQRLIDGGVWANNPSVIAIAEAVHFLDAPVEDIHVLNVGTTQSIRKHPRYLDHGGLAPWARRAAPLVVEAASRGTAGTADHLLGQSRFVRFDAQVPAGLFALDKARPPELAGAASSAARRLQPTFEAHFRHHQARTYTPLYPTTPTTQEVTQ
jgi:uncharacterized protein